MLVDIWTYWISFIQVVLSAAVLLVILPMFLWRKYLRGKSRAFCFVFSVVTQNAFLINLVILLGFMNILSRWTVLFCLGIYCAFISWTFSDRKFIARWKARLAVFRKIIRGTVKLSTVKHSAWLSVKVLSRNVLKSYLWVHIRKNLLEYLVLLVAVCYNAWFMAHNALIYHSVQFSDIPVHQAWVYGLNQGTLFVGGIYPFGMHAIVYLIQNLFFLDLREVLLYFGVFQTILLFLSTYFLARELFRWKYAAFIVVISFSLLMNESRYVASLPQECGMFAVSAAAYSLLRFLRTPLNERTIAQDGKIRRFSRINQYFTHKYMTTDVLLFMLAVALCVQYHFYTAIAACSLVISMLVAHYSRIVYKRYWVPIVAGGIIGVLIAVLPFAASYARGVPFQGSMQWALTVMGGEQWQSSDADYMQQLEQSLGENSAEGTTAQEQANVPEADKRARTDGMPKSLKEKAQTVYQATYNFSLSSLFGNGLTEILMISIAIGVVCAILYLPFKRTRVYAFGYSGLLIYIAVMLVMGAAQTLGIPEIIPAVRASTFTQPFLGIVYAVPFDFAFGLLAQYRGRAWRAALSFISFTLCATLIFLIFMEGWERKQFDVKLAYYNEPDYLVKQIRKDYEKGSFTIVSPTDEYYQIVDYGYHEELSHFMNMVNNKNSEYYIPTKNVFIFIEKKVLNDYYYGSPMVSLEYASKDFIYMGSIQDYYFQRAVLQSQAYYWAQAYQKMYPNTFITFFENEIYVCYALTQNPYFLNNFHIDYLSAYEKGEQK